MRTHMREQNYVDRAKLNPARAFKTPCAPKTKGWVEASMRIFRRCKRPSPNLARSFARPAQPSRRPRSLDYWSSLGAG